MPAHRKDITGKKFGMLTVLGCRSGMWNCKCDCGTLAKAAGHALRSGRMVSCGCRNRANVKAGLRRKQKLVASCECGDHVFSTLTQGYVGLVSPQDASLFENASWCAIISSTGRPMRVIDGQRRKLHREIMRVADPKTQIDHINGCVFDNRRSNLRACTSQQNLMNRKVRSSRKKTSKFKGVFFAKSVGRWGAKISAYTVHRTIGYFDSEEEAARAYDIAALKLHGEFARTNASLGLLNA